MTVQLPSLPEYNFFLIFFFSFSKKNARMYVRIHIYMLNYGTEKSEDFFIVEAFSI